MGNSNESGPQSPWLTPPYLLTEEDWLKGASAVKYIVVHCTATGPDVDYTPSRLQADHRARGFRSVGYHYYIRRDGSVTQHRWLLQVGAHCYPHNRRSIGVCYEGGLDAKGRPRDTRTDSQRAALVDLLGCLKHLFPQAEIVGHRDLPGVLPKDCPCFDAKREYGGIKG